MRVQVEVSEDGSQQGREVICKTTCWKQQLLFKVTFVLIFATHTTAKHRSTNVYKYDVENDLHSTSTARDGRKLYTRRSHAALWCRALCTKSIFHHVLTELVEPCY